MSAPPRVIIVEDHGLVRQMLARIIVDDLALEVAAQCATLKEGCATCIAQMPDLVLVDWALPDGKGLDLVRTTRGQLPETRWICVSSNEQHHLVAEALDLGLQGFILKRSSVEIFKEGVRAVLKGETYYCPVSSRLAIEGMRDRSKVVGLNLSDREREILRGVARGASAKQIAAELGIQPKTAHNHLANLKDKLGIHEVAGLVRYAIKHGLAEEP